MTRPRVLLVEDEALVAMMMEDVLEDLGWEVAGSFADVDVNKAVTVLLAGNVTVTSLNGISAAQVGLPRHHRRTRARQSIRSQRQLGQKNKGASGDPLLMCGERLGDVSPSL